MIKRVRSSRRGGARPGGGRTKGRESEFKRVAKARAEMTGELPHELMLKWARTGRMDYPHAGKMRARTVELEPSDRIACAKGCAAWYKPAMQPRPAPGEQPQPVRLELDEKLLAALAARQPDKLEILRDVLLAIQSGGGDMAQAGRKEASDPGRYGRMLSETSDVAGRA